MIVFDPALIVVQAASIDPDSRVIEALVDDALRLVHADESGHWPWEPSYAGVLGGQPVLGVRASPPSG